MCLRHWRLLPLELQRAVWAVYVPGQEIRKDPTREYLAAARAAIRYIERLEGLVSTPPDITGLQTRVEAARTRQARAAFELEQAQAARDKALSELQENFGVSTPAEVQALRGALAAEVEAELATVQQQLAAAEGGVPA